MKICAFFILSFLVGSLVLPSRGLSKARTGGDLSGGGDAVICSGFLIRKNVTLADFFGVAETLGIDPNYSIFDLLNKNQAEDVILGALEKSHSGFGRRLNGLRKKLIWQKESSLEELEDDNIQGLNPFGGRGHCFKKQLAIQSLALQTIRINNKLHQQLNNFEKILLEFHEAMIQDQYLATGSTDSEKAREILKLALLGGDARSLALQNLPHQLLAFTVLQLGTASLTPSFVLYKDTSVDSFRENFSSEYTSNDGRRKETMQKLTDVLESFGVCPPEFTRQIHHSQNQLKIKTAFESFIGTFYYKNERPVYVYLRKKLNSPLPAECRANLFDR